MQDREGEADRHQQLQRAGGAKQVEQQEPGYQAAHAVADDVGELDQADAAAKSVEIALHGLLHHGEGETHDEGGGQHDHQQQQNDLQDILLAATHNIVVYEV